MSTAWEHDTAYQEGMERVYWTAKDACDEEADERQNREAEWLDEVRP